MRSFKISFFVRAEEEARINYNEDSDSAAVALSNGCARLRRNYGVEDWFENRPGASITVTQLGGEEVEQDAPMAIDPTGEHQL